MAQEAGPGEGAQAPEATAPAGSVPRAPEPDFRDLYLRAAAELENYRKRAERERASFVQYAAEGIVRKLLEPYDAFERAILELERVRAEAPASDRPGIQRSIDGLRAVQRQLQELLAAEGVLPIKAEGQEFDPEFHEALLRVPSASAPSGTVVEVLQSGYTIRGKVLRPARVAVSAGPAPSARSGDHAPLENSSPGHKPGLERKQE